MYIYLFIYKHKRLLKTLGCSGMADISTSTGLSDRLSNVKLSESWETVLESIHATFLCSSSLGPLCARRRTVIQVNLHTSMVNLQHTRA